METINRAREENRSKSDAFTWTVSEDEVTVTVPLPDGCGKRDVSVVCDTQALQVSVSSRKVFSNRC